MTLEHSNMKQFVRLNMCTGTLIFLFLFTTIAYTFVSYYACGLLKCIAHTMHWMWKKVDRADAHDPNYIRPLEQQLRRFECNFCKLHAISSHCFNVMRSCDYGDDDDPSVYPKLLGCCFESLLSGLRNIVKFSAFHIRKTNLKQSNYVLHKNTCVF